MVTSGFKIEKLKASKWVTSLCFSTFHRQEGKKNEEGTSVKLALVPECGVNYINMQEKRTKTKTHLHRMTSEEKMPPENERTYFRKKVNGEKKMI